MMYIYATNLDLLTSRRVFFLQFTNLQAGLKSRLLDHVCTFQAEKMWCYVKLSFIYCVAVQVYFPFVECCSFVKQFVALKTGFTFYSMWAVGVGRLFLLESITWLDIHIIISLMFV